MFPEHDAARREVVNVALNFAGSPAAGTRRELDRARMTL
jgi:hypothetical protein